MSSPDPSSATQAPARGPAPAPPPGPAPSSYEAASARLEAIIRRLDSGEAELRETLDLCREGRGLVEYCAAELDAVGQGLEELRLDELVARLEAGAAGGVAPPGGTGRGERG
jgi:exodeoxyribonuclease VII small subunit